jgi:transcriptional regulator of acetoin/glycerol metabolism
MASRSLKQIVEDTEKDLIIKALVACNGDARAAAKMVGIHFTSMFRKIKKYGIEIRRVATIYMDGKKVGGND